MSFILFQLHFLNQFSPLLFGWNHLENQKNQPFNKTIVIKILSFMKFVCICSRFITPAYCDFFLIFSWKNMLGKILCCVSGIGSRGSITHGMRVKNKSTNFVMHNISHLLPDKRERKNIINIWWKRELFAN